MQELTVREYAQLKNVNERTVRKWIEAGRIPAQKKTIDNREITVVLVNTDELYTQKESGPNYNDYIDVPAHGPAHGEIVGNLVSMENTTFEKLIDNIKIMADDRASTDQQYIKKLEEELFQIKAELKEKTDKLLEEKIMAAQTEAELKIKDLRISEIETNIKNQQEIIQKQELDKKDLQTKIYELQETTKENDRTFDHKLREKDTEIARLVNDKISIENELRKSETSYKEIHTKLLETESNLNKVNNDLDVKEKHIQELLTTQDTLKNQGSNLQDNNHKLQDSISKYETELKSIQEKCQTLESSNLKLQEQIKKLESDNNNLKEELKNKPQGFWALLNKSR